MQACGKPGNLFDPQGSTTRAKASAILRRSAEQAINDSGRELYRTMELPLVDVHNDLDVFNLILPTHVPGFCTHPKELDTCEKT